MWVRFFLGWVCCSSSHRLRYTVNPFSPSDSDSAPPNLFYLVCATPPFPPSSYRSARPQPSGARPLDGWTVRGRLAPSVHPSSAPSSPPCPPPTPFPSSCLIACLLATWSVRAPRREAQRFLFLFLLLVLLLWLGTAWDALWRTARTIAFSLFRLLSFQ